MKNYNVTGEKRKQLVSIIGEVTGIHPKYMMMPTCAYQVGGINVSKTGMMSWDGQVHPDVINRIEEALGSAGFVAADQILPDSMEAIPNDSAATLTISIPLDGGGNIDNLQKLVASKAALIKKSLNADSLEVKATEETISFPWWNTMPEPVEIRAYTELLSALCRRAKEVKRVTATEKTVESEKYAFRCFLIRLGFNGSEKKETRRELLKRLSGHSAFRNQEEADKFYARQRGMKADRS